MCTFSVICGSQVSRLRSCRSGRCRVVVSGAEVAIAAGDAVFVVAHQHGQLAVCLQPHHAVKYLGRRRLPCCAPSGCSRPRRSAPSVPQRGYFLGGRGFGQRFADRRVAAGAVERLLHGENQRVFGALLDEFDDGVVGVVGVMEQDVVLAEFIEDVRDLRSGGGPWA